MIHFTVPGIAAPQGSKKAFRTKGGRIALVESSPNVKPYRASVASAAYAAGAKVLHGPIFITVVVSVKVCVQRYPHVLILQMQQVEHPGIRSNSIH